MLRKVFLSLQLLLLAVGASAQSNFKTEFHGYLRSGAGTNLRGGGQQCLNAAGSAAGNEFRIGNECGTYGEAALSLADNSNFIQAVTRFAYTADNKADWENSSNPWVLREAFIESQKTSDVPVGFWAGKRFFRWGDIYFLDYYPMNWSGPGGGVHSMKMWGGDAQIAVTMNSESKEILGSGTAVSTEIGNAAKTMLHFRLEDLSLSPNATSVFGKGKTSIWLIAASTPATKPTPENGTNYKAGSGFVASAKHFIKWQNTWSEVGAAVGTGVVSNLGPWGELVVDCNNNNDPKCTVLNSQHWRMWNQWVYEQGPLSWQGTLAADFLDRATNQNSKMMWLSAGIQPTYWVNEHRAWFAGLGLSHVNDEADGQGARNLWRLTVGPQVQLSKSYFARPLIRAFYTYTGWSRGNENQFASQTGLPHWQMHTLGMQGEIWF